VTIGAIQKVHKNPKKIFLEQQQKLLCRTERGTSDLEFHFQDTVEAIYNFQNWGERYLKPLEPIDMAL
jgi:hypothetical protein